MAAVAWPSRNVVWLLTLGLLARSSHAMQLQQQHSRSSSVTLQLRNHQNQLFVADVNVGGQLLPAVYDTGSWQVLVLSSKCHNCGQMPHVYDSAISSSYVPGGGGTEAHRFASGMVHTTRGFEQIAISGSSGVLSTPRLTFFEVVANSMEVWDETAPFAGIVGLGHAEDKENLLSALGVQSFSFCLRRDTQVAPGLLVMDTSSSHPLLRSGAAFKSIPILNSKYWATVMTDVALRGFNDPNICTPSCAAIIDSGTSVVTLPPAARGLVRHIETHIQHKCDDVSGLPSLRFMLAGVQVELPPELYLVRKPNTLECSHVFVVLDKASPYGPVWVLGLPFLRAYYSVFNRALKQVSLAPSDPSCTLLDTASGHAFWSQAQAGHATNKTRIGPGKRQLFPIVADLSKPLLPAWALDNSSQLAFRSSIAA